MAVNLPSDLILDVARAADPSRLRAAAERLHALPLVPLEEQGSFTEALEARSASLRPGPSDPMATLTALRNGSALRAAGAGDERSVYRRFEAFVLQTFVESILPKEASSVFGKGTSGSIWRSMLAEQIAGQVAEAGGVGIADRLVAARSGPDAAFAARTASAVPDFERAVPRAPAALRPAAAGV
ncbi:rod-binding protein [Faunimonas sp. B44]|uniref:rod-binding protein n=1 Tax=Faunimonas sp. B44 TaxID=3461493 RepID=UPI004043EE75